MSKARVHTDVGVVQPKEYWDCESVQRVIRMTNGQKRQALRECNGVRLHLSPMDKSDSLAFARSFLLLPLLPCAAPSIVEGEDYSFLRHQWIPLKLLPLSLLPSTTSTAIATTICNFLHHSHCRPKGGCQKLGNGSKTEPFIRSGQATTSARFLRDKNGDADQRV
ncbi:hypothetical protein C4D60_Mb04t30480 [Musa balbisiana]|uniref:Uncharacterized protein n=1 Tax=Musa balbisiana TaxID=52838 RepID=A0A4S8KFS4_MUSBA|nr:hypothetical protein C4D60_Mb04t30480 [Musa balbisiana]